MTEQTGAISTRSEIQAGSILYRVSWFDDGPRAMAMHVASVHPGGCGYYMTRGTGPMYGYEVAEQDRQGNALIHTDFYFSPREALEAELEYCQLKVRILHVDLGKYEAQVASLQRVIDIQEPAS